MNTEEMILGGTMNHVVKIGDTVRRQAKGHPLVREYLIFLEKEGMPGVPRFLGVDEQGREILSYVPGKTAESDYGFDHELLHSDQAIRGMARFMRKLHDISAKFLPEAAKGGWINPMLPRDTYETICHGDAAIWNFALVNGRITGMFDFDQACPGTRAWDLAITVFSAVLVSCYDYEPSKHEKDTRRRLGLFFDAYGMECPGDIIAQATDRLQAWLEEEAVQSPENSDSVTHYQNVLNYLRKRVNDWV